MHQWTGSTLVQVMACRLLGTKPLHEAKLIYCKLDSWEQASMKFESECYHLHSRKCIWKCCLPKWWPFCPEGDELTKQEKECFPDLESVSRDLWCPYPVNVASAIFPLQIDISQFNLWLVHILKLGKRCQISCHNQASYAEPLITFITGKKKYLCIDNELNSCRFLICILFFRTWWLPT